MYIKNIDKKDIVNLNVQIISHHFLIKKNMIHENISIM
jgi:hypothetical protein